MRVGLLVDLEFLVVVAYVRQGVEELEVEQLDDAVGGVGEYLVALQLAVVVQPVHAENADLACLDLRDQDVAASDGSALPAENLPRVAARDDLGAVLRDVDAREGEIALALVQDFALLETRVREALERSEAVEVPDPDLVVVAGRYQLRLDGVRFHVENEGLARDLQLLVILEEALLNRVTQVRAVDVPLPDRAEEQRVVHFRQRKLVDDVRVLALQLREQQDVRRVDVPHTELVGRVGKNQVVLLAVKLQVKLFVLL